MHDKSHVVDRLPVHLPRQQVIIAAPGAEREAYEKALGKRTKLEAYFDLNRRLCACVAARLPAPQPIPYEQMPSRYTWNSKTSEWVPRVNASAVARVLGRLTSASVSERERCFLRTLLKYVHDATGYEDLLLKRGPDMEPLQPLPQAAHHATFYDAAMNLGLMADDQLSRDTFSEALAVITAPALRILFVLLPEWMPFADSHQVWEQSWHALADDYFYDPSTRQATVSAFAAAVAKSTALQAIRKLCRERNLDPDQFPPDLEATYNS